MRRILITGSSGFIGQYLRRRFEESGLEIFLVHDLFSDKVQSENLKKKGPFEVFHLASLVGVENSWSCPGDFINTNAGGTARVLDFCRETDSVLRFFSSPDTALFNNIHTDDGKKNLANPYLFSKHLADRICYFFSDYYGVDTVILRLFNVYGPGQSTKFLIPMMIKQLLEENKIYVKNLHSIRDYIFIDDVVDAIMKIHNMPDISGEIILGTGIGTSVEDVISEIGKVHPFSFETKCIPSENEEKIVSSIADVEQTEKILNWKSNVSLFEGIKRTYEKMNRDYVS